MHRTRWATWCSSTCPRSASTYKKGEVAGVVESVKAAADMYMPVEGEVVEVNEALRADPALANTDPMGHGWFFKVHVTHMEQFDELMDPPAYDALLEDALIPAFCRPHAEPSPTMLDARPQPLPAGERRRVRARHIGPHERRSPHAVGDRRRVAPCADRHHRAARHRPQRPMDLPAPASEAQALAELRARGEATAC
jgi:hypothetical protein